MIFFKEVVPRVLEIVKQTLEGKDNCDYLVSEELTVADLLYCEFIFAIVIDKSNSFGGYSLGQAQLDKFPEVEAYSERDVNS